MPAHELGLLLEACRTSDNLDALAKVIAQDGPVADGKPHPAKVRPGSSA